MAYGYLRARFQASTDIYRIIHLTNVCKAELPKQMSWTHLRKDP